MASTVRQVVSRVLSNNIVEDIEPQNARPGNKTAYVEFVDREPVYVKIDENAVGRIRREVAAVRHAEKHASVNVPEIVSADPDAEFPYMITRPLSGELMNDRWTAGDDREELMKAVGSTIAATHDAKFEQVGIIEDWDHGTIQCETLSWTEVLCTTVRWRSENEFSDRFSELPDDLITTIEAINPTLERESASLLHGDPSRVNIHLEPNGLLDWERALIGDPAFDLVETLFHHVGQYDVEDSEKPALRTALFDGYREQRGHLPKQLEAYEPLYWAIVYLLAPQTFDKWAPQADEPIDEIETNVRKEAYSRINAAKDALL